MLFNDTYWKAACNLLKINYNKGSTSCVNVFVFILTLLVEISDPV